MNSYDRGDLVRLTGTFKNAAGAPTNPTTVTLRVRDPSGIVSTPNPANASAGVYEYDLSLNLEGTWTYRYEGVGAVQQAEETQLYVRRSAFFTA